MAAYNFKSQFVEPIRDGTKHHTIRADRKDGRVPAIGELLALYCGMRTKGCFKILDENPPCTRVQRISIRLKTMPECQLIYVVLDDGELLDSSEAEQLARCDGFPDFKTMMKFWEGRLPFTGNIIHWRPPVVRL